MGRRSAIKNADGMQTAMLANVQCALFVATEITKTSTVRQGTGVCVNSKPIRNIGIRNFTHKVAHSKGAGRWLKIGKWDGTGDYETGNSTER